MQLRKTRLCKLDPVKSKPALGGHTSTAHRGKRTGEEAPAQSLAPVASRAEQWADTAVPEAMGIPSVSSPASSVSRGQEMARLIPPEGEKTLNISSRSRETALLSLLGCWMKAMANLEKG